MRSSVLLILLLAAAPIVAAEANLTDQDIQQAIENELFLQTGVSFHLIDVEVNDDIATLDGTVYDLLAKDRAAAVAERVRGVRSVINAIDVEASGRTDSEIRSDIESALLTDPATDSYELSVMVDEGAVTLSGEVDSWQERELASTVAKGVRGVTALDNQVTVAYTAQRSDPEVRAEIERRMLWDVRLDDGMIDVAVNDGDVTLSGVVGSAAERSHAAALAWTSGVESVDASGLEVRSWARDENLRQDKYVDRSDEEIRQAVSDAFLYDPRVLSFHPTVTVRNGVVTLTGTVDNLKAKQAAGESARNTVGVWRVRNLLKVRPDDLPPDQQVAKDIETALQRDSYTEGYEMNVAVHRGEANLYGTVDSYYEKMRATEVVSGIEGVLSVDNNLQVDTILTESYPLSWGVKALKSPYVTDSQGDWAIREDIKDQLFWSPFVDADEVSVSVSNGVATLTGMVDTWSERRTAEANAREGGADLVVNNLQVDYGPTWFE